MNYPPILIDRLTRRLGGKVEILHCVNGGCISAAAIIRINKEGYFLKWNANVNKGFFASEAHGLDELSKSMSVKVPKVVCYEDNDKGLPSFIVLEVLEAGKKTSNAHETLGRLLAKMHRYKAEDFGFYEDNFIGYLQQKNLQMKSWGEFFFENRLVEQAKIGSEAGWFDYNFDRLFQKKKDKIIELLNAVNDEGASLLHGDLWGENVFWSKDGAALIDPAVYYGSREADIAFSEMFGGFDRTFYDAYNEVWPLSEGYYQRKQILNLYHLMTHSNMFGGDYISSAYSTLTKI